jgi:hypothetical protein
MNECMKGGPKLVLAPPPSRRQKIVYVFPIFKQGEKIVYIFPITQQWHTGFYSSMKETGYHL